MLIIIYNYNDIFITNNNIIYNIMCNIERKRSLVNHDGVNNESIINDIDVIIIL